MKKILFASTALVALAGAAQAEIKLTGNAEMGIFNADTLAVTGPDAATVTSGNTGFFTDIDVTFTMAGTTDGGLEFGTAIDIDEGVGAATGNDADDGGIAIFIKGSFGTLTMGDTDGAIDWALTEVNYNSGSLADNETGHLGFNGNGGLDGLYDGQILRYEYEFASFGVALSAELDDTDGAGNDDVFGIGFKYDLDLGATSIALGLGYQTASVATVDVDTVGVSANASFGGGFTAGFSYVTYENHFPFGGNAAGLGIDDFVGAPGAVQGGRVLTPGADTDHVGVGVGYSAGLWSANLNYGQYDHDAGYEAEGFGLSVGYDLGGGAIVQFGYGDSELSSPTGASFDTDTMSFGVRMNF